MVKEKWDEQFSTHPFTYGKTANPLITEKHHLFSPASHIACFAEGEGRNAVYLAKLGHNVTAYDVSSVGLQHANLLAKENNVIIETVEADLTKTKPEQEQYDGAIMIFGHVEQKQQETFFANIIQSVKTGGYVMIEVYSNKQLEYRTGGPGNALYLYDPIDILKWINNYHCVHFYYGEAKREEGYRHTGVGHVIQIIIRK